MDKKIVGLLGAAAALTTVTGAHAATSSPQGNAAPGSYQELLDPVANPIAALKADDARLAQQTAAEETQVAQVFYHHHHHHHHHMVPRPFRRFLRRHHHHHHHHHHHGYYR